MKIEQLMNSPDWREILESKDIMIKEEGSYVLLKYGITANWSDDIVKQCRGIIFKKEEDGSFRCVCKPFDKFYNVQEENAAKIDWASARVQEKIDGSIQKLWYDEGTWHWSTNSVIDASSANLSEGWMSFLELIKKAENYKDIDFNKLDIDKTYMFELVSPYNRVVIPYNDIMLYHIGTRDNNTGEEFEIDIGIKKPKNYPLSSLDECMVAAEKLNDGEITDEGFVVVDKFWNRIKIKSPEYVALHHVVSEGMGAWNAKNLVKILDNEIINERIKQFPLLKDSVDKYRNAIEYLYNELSKEITLARGFYEEYGYNRKDAAEEIKKFKYPQVGFWALDNKGDTNDYIRNLRENKYYEMLDTIVANSE